MTRTFSFNFNILLLPAMAVAVALCCLFSFAPKAQAAQLTEAQIQAIEGLLSAFNVDQATVATVDNILRYPEGDVPTGEVLGVSTGPDSVSNNKDTTVTIGGKAVSVPSGTEIVVPDDYSADSPTHDLPEGVSYDELGGLNSLNLAGMLQGLGINQDAPGAIAALHAASNSNLPPLPPVLRAAASVFPQLYRYVSVVNGVNVYQDSTKNITGWVRDIALGYISPASGTNLAVLHQCVYTATLPNGDKVHNYLSTTLSKCPPASPASVEDKGVIGYVWSTAADYLTPVYTCLHKVNLAYVTYSSLNPSCENPLDESHLAYYLSKAATLLPAVSIDASPTQVQSGDSATVSWAAQNVANCAVTAGGETLGTGLKGKKSTGDLTDTTTYNLTCAKLDQGFAKASKTVVVSAAPDTTAPTLSMPSPHEGQVVRGTVYVSANAKDLAVGKQSSSGVKTVTFFIDGKKVAETSAAPYGYVWNTGAVATGTHTVMAVALDNANNSQTLTHTVNVAHTPEPVVLNPLSRYVYDYKYFHESLSYPSTDSTVTFPPQYKKATTMGYLASTEGPGLEKFSACLVEYNSKYHLKDVYSSTQGCNLGGSNQGTLGYLWKGPGSDDTRTALYRCTTVGSYDPWWDLFGWYEVTFIDRYDSTSGWCGAPPIPLRGPQVGGSCAAAYVGGDGYPATLMCASGGGGEQGVTYSPLPDCKSVAVPAGWQYNDLVIGGESQSEGVMTYTASCYAFKKVSAEEYYKTLGIPMPGKLLGYISKTKAVPVELSLSVSSSTVQYGATPEVEWAAPAAAACDLSLNKKPFSTTNATVGVKSTPPLTDTSVVRLHCISTAGSNVATTTTITVTQPDEASCSLAADPKGVAKGNAVTLSWTTDRAVDGKLDHALGSISPLKSGSIAVTPATTTAYTLVVHNKAGVRGTCSATTTVLADTDAPKVSFAAPQNNAQVAATTTITVNFQDNVGVSQLMLLDGTTTLRSIAPSKPASGANSSAFSYVWNTVKAINGPHALSAIARDAAGNGATTTITVDVENLKAPQLSINATPATIKVGATTTVAWSANNVTQCSVYKDATLLWNGLSGSEPIALSASATFILNCQTALGAPAIKSASVTVMAGAPKLAFSAKPAKVVTGTDSILTWSATNVSQCGIAKNGDINTGVEVGTSGSTSTGPLTTTTTYSFGCQALNGSQPVKTLTVTVKSAPPPPAPVLSISASPLSIARGGSSTLTWSATNVSQCAVFVGSTPVAQGMSGSQSTGPLPSTTSFTLGCQGTDGSQPTKSVTVTVSGSSSSPARGSYNYTEQRLPAAAVGSSVSDLVASVIMAPFSIATDVLSDFFVAVGIGQEPAAVAAAPAAAAKAPPAKLSITASPSTLVQGKKTAISWSAKNVQEESCVVSASVGENSAYIGNGAKGLSKVALSQSARFALHCSDLHNNPVTASVLVTVSNDNK